MSELIVVRTASSSVCVSVWGGLGLCQWAPRLAIDSSPSLAWTNWTASMREVIRGTLNFYSVVLMTGSINMITWQLCLHSQSCKQQELRDTPASPTLRQQNYLS